jgi:hypothetical protein
MCAVHVHGQKGSTSIMLKSILVLAVLHVCMAGAANGLRLEEYNNTQALGSPVSVRTVPTASLSSINGSAPLSLRLLGTWTPGATGDYVFSCECEPMDHLFLWVDDHMLCDTKPWTDWQAVAVGPASIPLQAGVPVFIRAHLHHSQARPSSQISMKLRLNNSGSLADLPAHTLLPTVPPLQAQRLDMQRQLLSGWDSWWSTIGAVPGYRGGMLSVALLPESFAVTVVLCQYSTNKCVSEATVAGTLTKIRVRPGMKALDASYAELFAPAPGGLNVSIQWASTSISTNSGSKQDQVSLVVAPLPNSTQHSLNLSDWAVALTGRFICWNGEQGLCSAGDVQIGANNTLVATAVGLRSISIAGDNGIGGGSSSGGALNLSHPAIIYPLSSPVAFRASTKTQQQQDRDGSYTDDDQATKTIPTPTKCSLAEVTQAIAKARAAEIATYHRWPNSKPHGAPYPASTDLSQTHEVSCTLSHSRTFPFF